MSAKLADIHFDFSALTLLVGWQEGHLADKKLVGCWCGYLSEVRCRLACGPADILLPLTVSYFSKIQTGFYRAMLCIRGTSHGPVSVRPSVCMSVCPSVRYKSVFY